MTNQKNNNTSPDGKWQITIDYYGNVNWVDLTKSNSTYTIEEEVVEATKRICPELWK